MSGRLRACARSIYQALFPLPPKSLGTRLPVLHVHIIVEYMHVCTGVEKLTE